MCFLLVFLLIHIALSWDSWDVIHLDAYMSGMFMLLGMFIEFPFFYFAFKKLPIWSTTIRVLVSNGISATIGLNLRIFNAIMSETLTARFGMHTRIPYVLLMHCFTGALINAILESVVCWLINEILYRLFKSTRDDISWRSFFLIYAANLSSIGTSIAVFFGFNDLVTALGTFFSQ